MTYAQIEDLVRAIIRQGATFQVVPILRIVENDFIERTWCTNTVYHESTEDLNEGTLAELYDLPTGFVKDFRVDWNGIPLQKSTLLNQDIIYDTSGDLNEGTPIRYWIENNQIRLFPKPSAHGYLTIWHSYYNTSTTGTSPIIPTIEHTKLVNETVAMYFEAIGEFDLADRFHEKYYLDTAKAFQRYKSRRGKQRTIRDGAVSINRYPADAITE